MEKNLWENYSENIYFGSLKMSDTHQIMRLLYFSAFPEKVSWKMCCHFGFVGGKTIYIYFNFVVWHRDIGTSHISSVFIFLSHINVLDLHSSFQLKKKHFGLSSPHHCGV